MGKVKAAAQETASDTAPLDVAVIVYGRDEAQRPHASRFAAVEAELAEKAAGAMAMWVLRVTTDEHRAAASELPAGKIFSSGKGFVPFCKEATHERLEAFGEAFQPAWAEEQASAPFTSVPADWSSIAVGALVLASEGPSKGYFEAVVTEAPGDDLFACQWRDWPSLPSFVRRREHLAVLTEALASLVEPLDEAPAVAAEAINVET